ncbi:putative C-_U-editing enzyme APOBEC-2 [Crotalus adamanteus]|uniref:C->U-editing enzyme APOBEC-2 n=1 Tax=Crotalus adamanteus TaxID=8729 RepID=A0AAW1BR20_CROAD
MAEKQEQPPEAQNGEKAETAENAEESAEAEKPKELEELPPFEIVTGERLPACFFNFQFKNVEYSSGRNKTFLCYIIEIQGKESKIVRGYLEDEHAAAHAEDAFFNTILPKCESGLRYNVTWHSHPGKTFKRTSNFMKKSLLNFCTEEKKCAKPMEQQA